MENPYSTPESDPERDPGLVGNDTTSPFSPKGRFTRLSYIAWYVLTGVVSILALLLLGGASTIFATDPTQVINFYMTGAGIFMIILYVVLFILFVIFSIRRLHDIDLSGWWFLLIILPLINIIFMFYLFLKPGTAGTNRFGPPRITPQWEKIVGIIGVVLIVLYIIAIIIGIGVGVFAGFQDAQF